MEPVHGPPGLLQAIRRGRGLEEAGADRTVKGTTEGQHRWKLRCWVLPKWEGGGLKGHQYGEDPALVCESGGGDGTLCRQVVIAITAVHVLDPLGGKIVLGSILYMAVKNR